MTDYLARVAAAGARTSAPARPPVAAPAILPETVASARPVAEATIALDGEAVADLSTLPSTSPVTVPFQTDSASSPPGLTGSAPIFPARLTTLARAPRSLDRPAVRLEPGLPSQPTLPPSTAAASSAPHADSATRTEPKVDDEARVGTPRQARWTSEDVRNPRAATAPAARGPEPAKPIEHGLAGGPGRSLPEREILLLVAPRLTSTAPASPMQVPPLASTAQPAAPRARVVVGRLDVQVQVTSVAPPVRPAPRTNAAATDPLATHYLDRFRLS